MRNVFAKQDTMEKRNLQIVYLHYCLKMTASQIKKYVDLSLSTIRQYTWKFSYLLEEAKEFFGDVVEAIKNKFQGTDVINFDCKHPDGYCAYIIEFFDSEKDFIWLKVGMTKNINRRIKEHLDTYAKDDITYAVVKKIIMAEDSDDAQTLENCLRKHYKKNNDSFFIEKDRFQNIRFSEADLQQDDLLQKQIQMFQAVM